MHVKQGKQPPYIVIFLSDMAEEVLQIHDLDI